MQNESNKFLEVKEALTSAAQLSVEAERIEVGKRVAAIITDVYREQGRKLSLKDMAKSFGLEHYLRHVRGGLDLDFAAAVADVLNISRDQVPRIETTPESVAEVVVEKIDKVFVPPGKKTRQIGTGQEILEKSGVFPRCKLALEVLSEIGIDLKTIKIFEGTVTDEMMRELPYFCFVIPSLNRMILVCEEEGNQTFMVYESQNYDKFSSMSKDQLKAHENVGFFRWNSDHGKWKEKMATHLLSQTPIKESGEIVDKTAVEYVGGVSNKMESSYFENVENLKYDLEAFAKALSESLGSEKTPVDLTTGNIAGLFAVCKNGEKITATTYLNRVGLKFGLKGHGSLVKILDFLLETAGYQVMNKEYFENIDNLKYDFNAFAVELGSNKTLFDLNAGVISELLVQCKNGEKLLGRAYLRRAAVSLGLVSTQNENKLSAKDVFRLLFEKAGYQLLDKKYFENIDNIKYDLNAYAKALGSDKTPLDLSSRNVKGLLAMCKNGEMVTMNSYIQKAGIALGLIDVGSKFNADTLVYLLEKAGFQRMGEKYFENPENLKRDMAAYTKALSESEGVEKSALDLNTVNMKKLMITCGNGESVSGFAYILRVGVAFGLYKNQNEAKFHADEILEVLFERAGCNPMTRKYFENVDNVRHDLGAYAKALGPHKGLMDFNSFNIRDIKAVCVNGEEITGNAYLSRAGVALGFGTSSHEANSHKPEILACLREKIKNT